jgi:hypothetical protein
MDLFEAAKKFKLFFRIKIKLKNVKHIAVNNGITFSSG